MATPEVLNEHASIVRRRKGVYHLLLSGVGRPGPDGNSVPVTCVLRGELREYTPSAVVGLVRSQPPTPGVLWREGPVEVFPGCIAEGSCRLPPAELADALAEVLGVPTRR